MVQAFPSLHARPGKGVELQVDVPLQLSVVHSVEVQLTCVPWHVPALHLSL